MTNLYRVTSNRESGNGRYDIQMKPYDFNLPGILIELKVPQDKIPDHAVNATLTKLAEDGLKQIRNKHYIADMQADGIKSLIRIGFAFYKKQVRIKYESDR